MALLALAGIVAPAVGATTAPAAHADATASVSGHVAGADVANLPDTRVDLLEGYSSNYTQTTTTDASGNYAFAGVSAGQYRLCFFHDGYVDSAWETKAVCTLGDKFMVAAGAAVAGKSVTMALASSISGTVSGAGTPAVAIDGGSVTLYGPTGSFVDSAPIVDGSFALTKLPAGSYRLKFTPSYDSPFLGEYWNDAASLGAATALTLAMGENRTGVDATLALGATISGHVDGAGAGAVQYVSVQASLSGGTSSHSTLTDADGNYTITSLPAGAYVLRFGPDYFHPVNFLTEYWNDSATQAGATLVTVPAGGTLTGYNAVLAAGGSISGTVKDGNGAAVADASVRVMGSTDSDYFDIRTLQTDGDGKYSIVGLTAGNYYLFADDNGSLAPQWWSNKTSMATATPIVVAAGQAQVNKNFVLAAGATISGAVKGPGGATIVEGASVTVFDLSGSQVASTTTVCDDSNYPHTACTPNYSVGGLAAGTYKVLVKSNRFPANLAPQWLTGKPSMSTATAITLTAGQNLTNQNATLVGASTISGKVTGDASAPVANVSVCALPGSSADFGVACAQTDSVGNYTIPGLGASSYKVSFETGTQDSYGYQWWSGKWTYATADLVAVGAGQAVAGKNVQLNRGSSIAGTVSNDDGTSAAGTLVGACRVGDVCVKGPFRTEADANGNYILKALTPGTYTLYFGGKTFSEYYNDSPTLAGAQTISIGTVPTNLTGYNASLGPVLQKLTTTPVPTVSGVAAVGSTLTAAPGTWGPAPVELAYSWARSGVAIPDAESSTYELTAEDAGSTITVSVRGSKDGYSPATKTSAATAVVSGGILTDTPFPTVTGALTVGQTLTAVPGVWGPGPVTFAYQWKRDGFPILGGTSSTYKIVAADAGKTLAVSVLGSRPGFTSVVRTTWTDDLALASLTGAPTPTITGTPTTGATLTAAAGVWSPAPVALSYQWYRDGTAVDGRTSAAYLLGADDAGTSLTVTVTGIKAGYTTVTKTSAPVLAGNVLTSAPAPTITGTPVVGQTLTATTGEWGPGDVNFAYQWKRGTLAIPGATSSTYVVQQADSGQSVTVAVTGSQSTYFSITKPSGGVTIGNAFSASPVPTISGTPALGALGASSTLTAVPGVWGPAPVTLTYQWKRDGVAVAGKVTPTYVLTNADAGYTVSVTVTGAKAGYGTLSRTSESTIIIEGGQISGPMPIVTGQPSVGSTLTVDPGNTWSPGPIGLQTYWTRDDAPIDGTDGSLSYTLTAEDLGHVIRALVTGSRHPGFGLTTNKSAPLTIGYPLEATATPTVTGTRTVGQPLTAVTGDWAPSGVAFTYQWKRGSANIAGATGATYTPVTADAGQALSVVVTGSLPSYTPATVASASVVVGNALTAPVPTVSGTPTVGSTLTATPGTWGPAPVALAYQWSRDGAPIAGKTASTYALTAEDASAVVTVSVTGTKALFTSATRSSAGTLVGAAITSAPVPTISGTATVGQVLSANAGSWGPGTVDLAYQWKRGATVIAGATVPEYELVDADAGAALSVVVTGSQAGYTSVSRTSATVVVGKALTSSTPTIAGDSLVGKTLTATAGTWGPAPVTLSYQWKRDGVTVAGRTAGTYVLAAADAGSVITVSVTGAKAGFTTVIRTSEPTDIISGGVLTPIVPAIGGTPEVGQTLTATPGTWGPAPVTLAYQWLRGGAAIDGATSSTYLVVADDIAQTLSVTVTGSRTGYATLTRTSAAVLAGAALPDAGPIAVTGNGVITDKSFLQANRPWSLPVQVQYEWLRGGVVVASATGDSYQLSPADAGQVITVKAKASQPGYISKTVTAPGVPTGYAFTAAPAPTISGTNLVGSTLTAVPGTWGPAPVTFTYQWLRNGEPIPGKTAATYLLTAADGQQAITVAVTSKKTGYLPAARTSSANNPGYPLTTAPVPTISGAPTQGQTLLANAGTWGPIRDDSTIELSYQWKRGATNIPGATESSYTLGAADVGATITVVVSGVSTPASPAVLVAKTSLGLVVKGVLGTATPEISGSAIVGQTLTATTTAWTPAPVALTYQWKRDGVVVAGKTAASYVLSAADAGATITVAVTGTKAGYATASETSEATTVVGGGILTTAPVPTISGTPSVGSTLGVTPGTWGPGSVSLAYQWRLDGAPVSGETGSSFVPASTGAVTVAVTGSRPGFSDAVRTSVPLTVGLAFESIETPSISGAGTVGEALNVFTGEWSPEATFTYVWKRGTAVIAGATGASYTPVAADVGKSVSVVVTGSAPGYTPQSLQSDGVVVGNKLTAPTPTLSGSPTVGSTLTAAAGTWGPAPVALTYQWFRNGAPIDGKTASTYVLVADDAGASVRVGVTGTKATYTTTLRTSIPVTIGDLLPNAPTPTIAGQAKVGTTLVGTAGTWELDPDLSYEWRRNGVAIEGATTDSYDVTSADVGKTITFVVRGTKVGYSPVEKSSVGVVGGNELFVGNVGFTGTQAVGSTITATPMGWTAGTTFTYQWRRDGAVLPGKTGPTYALTQADAGSAISFIATGSKAGYISESKTSGYTSPIPGGILTAPVPTISGAPSVDSTLTAVPGAWGPGSVELSYQWFRAGVAIEGAAGSTYTLTVDDIGAALTVKVTGARVGFTTTTKTSATVTGTI